jgi:hypothetical protein
MCRIRYWPALDTTLLSRGADAPEVIKSTMPSRKQREQGKPGAHDTRSRAQKCTRRTAGAPEHPAFPAQWFYGLCRDLPGAEFLWPPSLTDWRLIESPVGPDNLHQLDTSNGCQDHTVLPSAASSRHTPRPARMLPEEVSTEAFKRRSSSRRPIAHGNTRPATTRAPDAAASTATCPNVRDDGQRPSWRDGMAGVVGVIWVCHEAEYFCSRNWTGQISLKLLEKIAHWRSGADL